LDFVLPRFLAKSFFEEARMLRFIFLSLIMTVANAAYADYKCLDPKHSDLELTISLKSDIPDINLKVSGTPHNGFCEEAPPMHASPPPGSEPVTEYPCEVNTGAYTYYLRVHDGASGIWATGSYGTNGSNHVIVGGVDFSCEPK
jgi:hypothetical protein